MRPVSVLIADDNEDYRVLLGRLVSTQADLRLVGSVGDGGAAVELAGTCMPDVVLVDLMMPGLDGFETTRRLKAMPAAPGVVALTAHRGSENRRRALGAGADAFVPKHEVDLRILDLIRGLARGTDAES